MREKLDSTLLLGYILKKRSRLDMGSISRALEGASLWIGPILDEGVDRLLLLCLGGTILGESAVMLLGELQGDWFQLGLVDILIVGLKETDSSPVLPTDTAADSTGWSSGSTKTQVGGTSNGNTYSSSH